MTATITAEQQHANFLRFAVDNPVIESIPDLPEITPDNHDSRYDGLPPDYNADFDHDDSIPIDFIDNPDPPNDKEPPPISNNRAAKKAELEQLRTEHDRKPFFTAIGALIAKPYPTDWLIKNYFERDKTVLLLGQSGCGKSFVVLDMALSIAAGIEWQGHQTKQGAVFYVCGEGKTGIMKRALAWAIRNKVSLENAPFFVSESAVVLPDKGNIEQLHRDIEISGQTPTLIIFDTLARCLDGDENQAKDISAFIQSLDVIRAKYNSTILVVHHSGKDESKGARGSSAIKGALDTEMTLSKTNGGIVLSVTKQKDHDTPKDKSFKFESVATNWLDDDMNAIFSAVLVEGELSKKTTKKLNANTQKMLDVLIRITKDGQEPPEQVKKLFPDSPEQIPEKVVTINEWQAAACEVMTVVSKEDLDSAKTEQNKKDALRMAFKRGYERLESDCTIGLLGDFVWCAYIPI